MKKVISTVVVTSLAMGMMASTSFGASSSFVDIEKSYAKDAIVELQAMDIIKGIDEQHFSPKEIVTRAQFAALIARVMGLDTSDLNSTFKDVKGWAIPGVEAVFKAGIVKGVGDEQFAPNLPLTREEAAVILVRALQLKGDLGVGSEITFKDSNDISSWAKSFIMLAQQYGLIQGNSDNTFGPKGKTNREMSAVMIMNLLSALNKFTVVPADTSGKPEIPVTPPVITKPESDPVNPPTSNPGGVWYPPYTPPTTEPPTTEPPTTEPPVTEPPVTEPPADADTIVPVVALVGHSVINLVYGSGYIDAGATATDNKDGDLTGAIVTTISSEAGDVVSSIDTSIAGTYTYHYNVSDAVGNAAAEVTRTVVVAAEVVEPPVVQPVAIRDVKLTSSNVVNSVYAAWGDTVTLTFTTDEEVWKLGNFKINGSNPTTFESVQTGDTWTYTATYNIELTDPDGLLNFQINVKNAAGIYSVTTEATTDGSSIMVDKTSAHIIGATIIPDGAERVMLQFQTNEDIDLEYGNLTIRFLDVNGMDVLNNEGVPVVKDKTWSGYLTSVDGSIKYSEGAEGNKDYPNVLPANTVLSTVVTSTSSYAGSEWYNAIAFIAIEARDNVGNLSVATAHMQIANPEAYVTAQDFGKIEPDAINGRYGSYNMGFKINLDKLKYSSIESMTGTLYDGETVVGIVSANTPERIAKYQAADVEYGGLDGQLSFDFADVAALDHSGVPRDAAMMFQSSYLEYTMPVWDEYMYSEKRPTSATLEITTYAGVKITIPYVLR